MHSVVETHSYVKASAAAGMTDEDRHKLCVFLSQNPDAGDLIEGTGGARKIRIPLKGKGKRGGARVVTYYAGTDVPVFLLDVYSKGDKINLTKAERNEMRRILADLADAYRDGVKAKTKKIGEAS